MITARKIKSLFPGPGEKYLFDANVWLYLLAGTLEEGDYRLEYLNLFEKLGKFRGENPPKIILPAAVMSEVINKMIQANFRDFKRGFPHLIQKRPPNRAFLEFKEDYRSHPQYQEDVKLILADFDAYSSVLEFVSDSFEDLSIGEMIAEGPASVDFTDYLIIRIAKKYGYMVVSNDADFIDHDVVVISANGKFFK
ncbi:PIN domain-containing protein [Dyadobacter alkalitolerans]|uniref:PIN domain-containing protein n=1 Tax=Dyadobacter alkalitolerans TaxID=492736 RepID=UPI00047D41CC|nr:PIN domain-containing protein [Dyadobacter alkalitolerans]